MRLGIVLAAALLGSLVGSLIVVAGVGGAGTVGAWTGVGVGFAISLAYAPWMIARTRGQTVGHRATSTRIVRVDGRPLEGRGALVREVLVKALLIEGVGGFLFSIPTLLNYLWPLWDERNEALHDKLCGTRVVEA